MVVYDVAAASPTSNAITVATLTFGQAQLMLSDATALQDEILAIAAVAVCGNGVCELGERPNSTAAAVNATGAAALQVPFNTFCTCAAHFAMQSSHLAGCSHKSPQGCF